MLSTLGYVAARHPFGFAVLYGGLKTLVADVMVQTVVERRKLGEIDQKRAAVFLGFGFLQVGAVQYGVYVRMFTRLFPNSAKFSAAPLSAKLRDTAGKLTVAKQVCLDMFVYHPFCYFPVFYICKEVVNCQEVNLDIIPRALNNYWPHSYEDCKALWTIFIPVSIIQFSVMPVHLRVPFNATVGFLWCAILSNMRGQSQDTVKALQKFTSLRSHH
mmetsp:Transcript_1488/g.2019  ORF Transcript_1488/g.2019 Transcript_1488/m.2019 type:complete len:215 (+) Transcript_1488:121-765(+)